MHKTCCVPKCRSDSRKLHKLTMYPWMSGVRFRCFPTHPGTRRRWCRLARKNPPWRPSQYSRICSRHFDGLNKDPTLFPYNNFKKQSESSTRKPPKDRSVPPVLPQSQRKSLQDNDVQELVDAQQKQQQEQQQQQQQQQKGNQQDEGSQEQHLKYDKPSVDYPYPVTASLRDVQKRRRRVGNEPQTPKYVLQKPKPKSARKSLIKKRQYRSSEKKAEIAEILANPQKDLVPNSTVAQNPDPQLADKSPAKDPEPDLIELAAMFDDPVKQSGQENIPSESFPNRHPVGCAGYIPKAPIPGRVLKHISDVENRVVSNPGKTQTVMDKEDMDSNIVDCSHPTKQQRMVLDRNPLSNDQNGNYSHTLASETQQMLRTGTHTPDSIPCHLVLPKDINLHPRSQALTTSDPLLSQSETTSSVYSSRGSGSTCSTSTPISDEDLQRIANRTMINALFQTPNTKGKKSNLLCRSTAGLPSMGVSVRALDATPDTISLRTLHDLDASRMVPSKPNHMQSTSTYIQKRPLAQPFDMYAQRNATHPAAAMGLACPTGIPQSLNRSSVIGGPQPLARLPHTVPAIDGYMPPQETRPLRETSPVRETRPVRPPLSYNYQPVTMSSPPYCQTGQGTPPVHPSYMNQPGVDSAEHPLLSLAALTNHFPPSHWGYGGYSLNSAAYAGTNHMPNLSSPRSNVGHAAYSTMQSSVPYLQWHPPMFQPNLASPLLSSCYPHSLDGRPMPLPPFLPYLYGHIPTHPPMTMPYSSWHQCHPSCGWHNQSHYQTSKFQQLTMVKCTPLGPPVAKPIPEQTRACIQEKVIRSSEGRIGPDMTSAKQSASVGNVFGEIITKEVTANRKSPTDTITSIGTQQFTETTAMNKTSENLMEDVRKVSKSKNKHATDSMIRSVNRDNATKEKYHHCRQVPVVPNLYGQTVTPNIECPDCCHTHISENIQVHVIEPIVESTVKRYESHRSSPKLIHVIEPLSASVNVYYEGDPCQAQNLETLTEHDDKKAIGAVSEPTMNDANLGSVVSQSCHGPYVQEGLTTVEVKEEESGETVCTLTL